MPQAPLNTIVQRMIDAGEPEANIAIVIKGYRDTAPIVRPDPPRDWSAQMGLHEPTTNRAVGFARGAATAAVDMLEGAASGAASTIYHGGDLVRRALGMDRVIDSPQAQEAMRAPDTFAGQAGRMVEQGAEFAVPLTKVSRAVQGAGLLRRASAEALASAGVAGVQSGGETAPMVLGGVGGAVLPFAGATARAVGRTAQRAAAGAQEGGVGGAIASAVRTVAPSEPRRLLIQGLKPRSTKIQFPVSLSRAIPEIDDAAQQVLGRKPQNIDDLVQATTAAKRRIWSELGEVRGTAEGFSVDGTPIADAMVQSIPKKLRLERSAVAKDLTDAADAYRQSFTLDDMDQLLKETNAEMEAFYSKYPQSQRKALAADPEWARLDAQAKAMRLSIDRTLDRAVDGAGDMAKDLRRRYGALMDVESETSRRVMVAQRQQPENLSEQIGAVRAAGDIARGAWKLAHGNVAGAADIAAGAAGRSTAKAIKDSQTTDALIRRAFEGYKGQRVPVQMPTRRPIAGYLPAGARPMGPAPDASFVRGVPAMPAQLERLALPPGRTVRSMPGEVQPDPSFVRGVPAQYGERWTPPAPEPPPVAVPTVPQSPGAALVQPTRARPKAQAPTVQPAKTVVTPPSIAETNAAYVPIGQNPKLVRGSASKPTQPKAPIKVDPPVVAARKVFNEITRVIDTNGAKSAAEVQQRVMAALTNELESAKQAAGFGQLEVVQRGAKYGNVVMMDGRPVATVDQYGRIKPSDFPGITGGTDTKGRTTWTNDATGKPIDLGDLFGSDPPTRDMTPAVNRDQSLRRVSAALSRVKGAGKITVQIPGDGTFTIERNPHAIQTLLDRLKSAGTSPWGNVVEGAKPAKPPSANDVNRRNWKPTW